MMLKLKDQSIGLVANIDTGSSCCIFERKYGEQLGFDIESGMRQTFGTVVGSFTAFGHDVTLSVADIEFDSMVYFAAEESMRRNVLGRYGWLDRVILGLVDYEGKMFINRYESE